ncbi:MAG: tol-pal system protein YbgF [Syntrophobacteraceae bacterium]
MQICNLQSEIQLERVFMKRANSKGMRKIFLLAVLIGLTWGCASTQQTSSMQQSINMLYDRVQTIDRRLEGFENQGKKSADLYARMEELQMRVGSLNGKIEELQHRVEQMARTQAQSLPPSEGQPAVTYPQTASPTPGATSYSAPQAGPPAYVTGSGQAMPEARLNVPEKDPERALYDKASELLQDGQYENARRDFQSLISKYPQSERADDALFSIGECFSQEKRYQDAIEAYQKVLDRYPNGNRVPHALFRQGTAFQQMGDSTAARILYERLIEKYPGTPQAQAAEKRLKQLQ